MKSKQVKIAAAMVAMAVAAMVSGAACAADRGTAKEAEALVKKGIAFIKTNGKDKGLAEILNKQGQFVDRDLYLIALEVDGKVLAHGANEKMNGKVMLEFKDADGKEFVREMVESAKSKNGSWTEYKYTSPVSKKVEQKAMYCEHFDGQTLVCGGAYKP